MTHALPNKKLITEASAKAILAKARKKKKPDWSKFSGVIQLKQDPLKLQKKWRNEW